MIYFLIIYYLLIIFTLGLLLWKSILENEEYRKGSMKAKFLKGSVN